ncbi:hypothetical protein LSAT2_030605 [Lamellibrachia satsuma]|nr:hypothetical protein LSAT2_030605 [Lamellibrachia satsuma]
MTYWWNESLVYNYLNASCSGRQCGHYAQMAWAKTTRVGCGWKMNCPMNEGGARYKYTFFVVCNYKPRYLWP